MINNENSQKNTESIFEPMDLRDATGKKLTRDEFKQLLEDNKRMLEETKQFYEQHKDDEMFRGFPRHR